MKPSKIYKYESFCTQALENLKNSSVYFATPKQFNDPFDCTTNPLVAQPSLQEAQTFRATCFASNSTSDEVKKELEKMSDPSLQLFLAGHGAEALSDSIENFASNRGICCFSEDMSNLLMWAHYGGKHKGFCLEYSTGFHPFSSAKIVTYVQQIPVVSVMPLLYPEMDSTLIETLYCTKSNDWKYEKEWRILHKEAGTLFRYPPEALTGVYFGPKASQASIDVVALITKSINPKMQLWQGKLSNSSFAVEFNEIQISKTT